MPNAFSITSSHAKSVDIDIGLASLQEEVGGYIEAAFTVPSIDGGNRYVTGYVNDEGLLRELPMCLVTSAGDTFSGPCIIVGLDYSTGDFIPLSSTEIAWLESSCEMILELHPAGMDAMRIFGLDLLGPKEAA